MIPDYKNEYMSHNSHFIKVVFKWRLLIAIIFALTILYLGSCKKKDPLTGEQITLAAQYFEANILNRNFVVDSAYENGIDITARFARDTFILYKNTLEDGPMKGFNADSVYTGSWHTSEDYGKLNIQINQPALLNRYVFFNRDWRFIEKNIPVMKISPWGSLALTKVYMRRL